jgi:Spy/CpxP family protein refolding chaperone
MQLSRIVTARFAALSLAGLLVLPALAFAGKGHEHARLERMCEQLSCTEQQREELARVFKQMHQDSKLDREAIRDLRKQMADEWLADRPDEQALARLADKVAAHERNIADRRLEAMLEVHALLSPEQRKQFVEHLEHLLANRDGKRKRE